MLFIWCDKASTLKIKTIILFIIKDRFKYCMIISNLGQQRKCATYRTNSFWRWWTTHVIFYKNKCKKNFLDTRAYIYARKYIETDGCLPLSLHSAAIYDGPLIEKNNHC